MKIVHNLGSSQIAIEDVVKPQPGSGEVLIQTVTSALCGSEMHSHRKAGHTAGNSGHEAAGLVAELGEGVETLSIGQRVGVSAIAGCGNCDYCHKGQYTWCEGRSFFGNMHSEYFVVPALACHILPDDVPWEVGVLITGDGLGVPYHTSKKIQSSDIKTVAVFGLGPVGLSHTMVQTWLGRQVIGIDRAPDRLELARQLGAAHTIAVGENTDVPAEVRAATDGRGADVCIEAAGVPVTAKQCFASVRTAGTVIFNGEQSSVDLSPSEDFIRRDITAIGAWFYHFSEYAEMLALFRGGLPIESLVTHKFPLEQAQDAYNAMEGKSGKVLLEYPSGATLA
jgi:threonine dehydrogenase-like Zn-dependent dehydrogenase